MSARFYVGGLSPNISKDDLQALFNRLAPVEEVHVPSAIVPALSRSFMIVKLKSEADGKAIAAVTKLNGSMWKGSKLRIEAAKPFFKERLETEKRIEAEKEALAAASTKAVIPKYNKKAPAVLSTLLPEKELASLPPRPAFLRIRRARCVPAYRVSEPVLCLHEQTFKKKAVKVDDRMRFAKHIIFDEDQVQQLLPDVEPFTIVTKPSVPVKKNPAEKLSKNKKKEKAKEAKAVEAGKATGGDDGGIEIVKKPAIGGGQRKGFGTLLAAATTAAANEKKAPGKNSQSSGGRLSQMAENEMDLDDDLDDDDMVRRFPMPQSHIEYAHADLSTGKTKILTEEETAAERQRMLAMAMMTLAAPPVVAPPPKKADNKKASAAAAAAAAAATTTTTSTSHPAESESKETITGRKRSLSNVSDASEEKQTLKSAMSPAEKAAANQTAATATTEEKRVKFKAALEEVREIPSRHDLKPSFVPSRLDDAVRNIFGAPKPTQPAPAAPAAPVPGATTDASQNASVTVSSSASSSSATPVAVPESHIMPSGYADMSTLKSIFDSGEQGGIWWDDNVGKVVERAAEERGQGFQNDAIFRAAEKYGIDVRMFDFSTPSHQDESTAMTTTATTTPHLSMTSGSGNTSMTTESTSLVFDFFGDGASVAPPTATPALGASAATTSTPLVAVASSSSGVATASAAAAAAAVASPIYLHDQMLDVLVPLARQFHRDRSEEDVMRDWERNKQRIFAIVTKKAKVMKKQAKASAKSSFRRGGAGGGGGGGGGAGGHHGKKDNAAGGGGFKKKAAYKK